MVKKQGLDLKVLTREMVNGIEGILKPGQYIHYESIGPSIVSLNRQMTENILLNLLSNAIRFSRKDKIELLTWLYLDVVNIKIMDMGITIVKEEQEYAFEPFSRVKNVAKIHGTELGLTIIAKHVEAMNGTSVFEYKRGLGTIFHISIPNVKPVQNETNFDH